MRGLASAEARKRSRELGRNVFRVHEEPPLFFRRHRDSTRS